MNLGSEGQAGSQNPLGSNVWSNVVKNRSPLSRKVRPLSSRKVLMAGLALGGSLFASASAFAQAVGGTIGAQVQTMAQEFSTAGGFAASTAMYVGALITFV